MEDGNQEEQGNQPIDDICRNTFIEIIYSNFMIDPYTHGKLVSIETKVRNLGFNTDPVSGQKILKECIEEIVSILRVINDKEN